MKTQKICTKVLFALVINIAFSPAAYGMGQRAPSSGGGGGVSNPAPTPPVQREPAAVTDPLTPPGFDVFSEVAYPTGGAVDEIYKSYRELLPVRNAQVSYVTDQCDSNLEGKDSFADRIAYSVELKMQPSKAQLGYVSSYFGLNSNPEMYMPNSLISHPLCTHTSSTLSSTIGSKVPSASTITKINTFASKMNEYRRLALQGDRDAYRNAGRLWSKFMMCLSYTESLTSADSSKSQSVSEKYAPSGYRRPAGVKFYEDPYQDAASKLNIGLFQFTPNSGGNIQACIREWNKLYPSCGISQTASRSELIRALGSSLQTFNAFCATAKISGMFAVQVNTKTAASTHPYNRNSSGTLKAGEDRCVTPHFGAKSYNHFGPLQNSTSTNLESVLGCTLKGE